LEILRPRNCSRTIFKSLEAVEALEAFEALESLESQTALLDGASC
jgi:hypothetical protein